MGEKIDSRSAAVTRWLMIYSRPLIFALLAVNVLFAGGLSLIASDESGTLENAVSDSSPEPSQSDLVLLSQAAVNEQIVGEDDYSVAEETLIKECRVWGPQKEASAFSELSATLEITGGFPEVVEVEIAGPPSFMVFVDVSAGSVQARQVMQELTALKIDNYRIARDKGEIISVGVFTRHHLAESQLQRIRDLGYATELETIERSQTVFTLHGYVESDSELFASSSHECNNEGSLDVSQY